MTGCAAQHEVCPMTRYAMVLAALAMMSYGAQAQYAQPVPVSVKSVEGKDGFMRWEVTYDGRPAAKQAESMAQLLRDTAAFGSFDKTAANVAIDGKTLTIGLKPGTTSKSFSTIKEMTRTGGANGVVTYQVKYGYNIPPMPERSVSPHVMMQDARWRGHTFGANDGITVRPTTREAGGTLTVTLQYAGGPYPAAKQ
jgi:hypothetical protein